MQKLAVFLGLLLAKAGLATTMHDNIMVFNNYYAGGSSTISFELLDYTITPGQPWGGMERYNEDSFDIHAGRHKSAFVVDWVKSHMLVPYIPSNAATSNWQDSLPDELNFAVMGNLTVTSQLTHQQIVCPNIILAQGKVWFTNRWWMFTNSDATPLAPGGIRLQCNYYNHPDIIVYAEVYVSARSPNQFNYRFLV